MRVFRVSSRAPVWGASLYRKLCAACSVVSSRAPVWGASTAPNRIMPGYQFQVVPPCGGHPYPFTATPLILLVSSRAPVWGASPATCGLSRASAVSSRAPVWGASCNRQDFGHIKMFQVVPPCGGHHLHALKLIKDISVSSRAPVWGASNVRKRAVCGEGVSSRAPVWGASSAVAGQCQSAKFQVVPPCGGHHLRKLLQSIPLGVSSRAPVWGASRSVRISGDLWSCFKSCPRVGGILFVAAIG